MALLKSFLGQYFMIAPTIAATIKPITQGKLIIMSALFFTLFGNIEFFSNVIDTYKLSLDNLAFLLSTSIVLTSIIILLLTVFSSRYTSKLVIIGLFIFSSFASYFMNTYHIIIDDSMLQNVFQTDIFESFDLLSFSMVLYVLILGILPSLIVYRLEIIYMPVRQEIIYKVKTVLAILVIILILFFMFSKSYTSFLREHAQLRWYTNPTYYIYSFGKYVGLNFSSGDMPLKPLGLDAKINGNGEHGEKGELIIMVVGEAARADRFSLNGYDRETNPLLKNEDLVSFSNMYSCGTSTAVSVPCMFSVYGRDDYSYKEALATENVIDVLKHTKQVDILWRDNNSDSKGVATRVAYENFKDSSKNPIYDIEARDEGMLVGLDAYVKKRKGKDIFIVLHQMGNHGPAYYKRYPKSFEKFTPVCMTNQLENCTQEEVSNAYDNAIVYTDYFLAKVITFLKQHSSTHETAMIYMSDHGESLGENGLYLHGLPYFIAPDNQKHVGALMWFGTGMRERMNLDLLDTKEKFAQDNLFHTILGLFEVDTKVYNKEKDILYKATNG